MPKNKRNGRVRHSQRAKKAQKEVPIQKESMFSESSFCSLPDKIEPLTEAQEVMMDIIEKCTVTVATGSAGTGKSFVAVAESLERVCNPEYPQQKIIITRPTVEACGEKIGFLPGSEKEKLDPYIQHIMDIAVELKYSLSKERVVSKHVSLMRGSSFSNAMIFVDEAQNLTLAQFELILTRVGKGSKIIFCGDPVQNDIRNSGLRELEEILMRVPSIGFIQFYPEDIVRSGLCQHVVEAFEAYRGNSFNN